MQEWVDSALKGSRRLLHQLSPAQRPMHAARFGKKQRWKRDGFGDPMNRAGMASEVEKWTKEKKRRMGVETSMWKDRSIAQYLMTITLLRFQRKDHWGEVQSKAEE